MTFDEIDKASQVLPAKDPAAAGVNYFLAHADDNAPDDAGKLESLQSLLAHATSEDAKPALAWFAARGLMW